MVGLGAVEGERGIKSRWGDLQWWKEGDLCGTGFKVFPVGSNKRREVG